MFVDVAILKTECIDEGLEFALLFMAHQFPAHAGSHLVYFDWLMLLDAWRMIRSLATYLLSLPLALALIYLIN